MSFEPGSFSNKIRESLRTALMGPQILTFLPALMLGGYWYGGEGLLLYMALLFPGLFALAGLFSGAQGGANARDGITGLRTRAAAIQALDQFLDEEAESGMTTAMLVVALDDMQSVDRQFGASTLSDILDQSGQRLESSLRDRDLVVYLGQAVFGIVLAPTRRNDLESLIQLSSRLQSAIAEPFSVHATRVYVSASIGFCSAGRLADRSGRSMVDAAKAALGAAQAIGAGSIRAYSPETKRRSDVQNVLRGEVENAIEGGQIAPWFQPQVSTKTGAISGFAAMPRWNHPEKGIISHVEFLVAISELGLGERLNEIMLYQSLVALVEWDKAGHSVPTISVCFSGDDLANSKLCEKIKWELDRFGLAPERLCIEFQEELVANAMDDTVAANIWALSELGCKIELVGFGTGNASLANIRRFAINRIKIDRSFVTRIDRDREQKNMVSAVLTMAKQLEIDTLADGVETLGEHAMLSQLGCGHVQGFSVARPMPMATAMDWITQHRLKADETVPFERKTGVSNGKADHRNPKIA